MARPRVLKTKPEPEPEPVVVATTTGHDPTTTPALLETQEQAKIERNVWRIEQRDSGKTMAEVNELERSGKAPK